MVQITIAGLKGKSSSDKITCCADLPSVEQNHYLNKRTSILPPRFKPHDFLRPRASLVFLIPLVAILGTIVGISAWYVVLSARYPQQYQVIEGLMPQFNPVDIRFLLNNERLCAEDEVYTVVIIHSKPDHMEHREVIRNTWGSVKRVGDRSVKLVFLLGRVNDPMVQSVIRLESQKYSDIVQGDFLDSYRNLTLKHLMGYQWVNQHCGDVTWILKSDDDIFIDITQLHELVAEMLGDHPTNTLACNALPSGTEVKRTGKWGVTPEEYSNNTYPSYCAGMAYLITPDLMKTFLEKSKSVPFFWVDDVYVTGMVAMETNCSRYYLNLRYSQSQEELYPWLKSIRSTRPPYVIVHVQTGILGWAQVVLKLWEKLAVYYTRRDS